jgi:tRNA uridine 5-carbamoylmethylation protein Kti12
VSVELVLTIGLPGCGKSTVARQWRDRRIGRGQHACLVTRDDLRMTLFGRLAPLDKWQEEVIDKIQPEMIAAALRAGVSVCVPDTNLNPERVARITSAAEFLAPLTFIDMRDIPLPEVLRRNEQRRGLPEYVPPDVIMDMAMKYKIGAPV